MPWLSSPWKPVCVPQNLSGSSSLSSRLLGSDSRDPQPSREPCVSRPPSRAMGPPLCFRISTQCLEPFTTGCYGSPAQCLGCPHRVTGSPLGLGTPTGFCGTLTEYLGLLIQCHWMPMYCPGKPTQVSETLFQGSMATPSSTSNLLIPMMLWDSYQI